MVEWVRRWDGFTLGHVVIDFKIGGTICYTEGKSDGDGYARLHVFIEKGDGDGLSHDIISVFDSRIVDW